MAEHQEYQVTARKWRPSEFNSVVGQQHVTQTLKNAIRSGRLHHAFLFSGPRGVGKTTTARILAKAVNCLNPSEDFEPCNECESCRQIVEGRSMDVVEIDGASNNSVEDVRKLRDNAKYPPVTGRYKLYVIDEVHMLSTSAFNALLKTLEEPPKHLIFIFATTEPHKVPATILSRCQRFDFRRMQVEEIVGRLRFIADQEELEIDDDALLVIAKKGDGSMRDAQSIFDQVISFCGRSVTYQQASEALNLIDQDFFFRVTDMMRAHDTKEPFALVEQVMRTGYDVQEFLIGLSEHLRNFLTVRATGSTRLIDTAGTYRERYQAEAEAMSEGDLIRALHLVLAAQQAIRSASQPRLRLELALLQLAVMDSTVELAALLEKIDAIPDGPAPRGGSAPSSGGSTRSGASRGTSAGTPRPASGSVPTAADTASPSGTVSEPDGLNPRASAAPEPSTTDMSSFPTSAPTGSNGERVMAIGRAGAGGRGTSNGAAGHASVGSAGSGDVDVLEAPMPTLMQIQGRWRDFLDHCRKRRTVWAALVEAVPAELYGDTIRLYVANDSQMMMLRRAGEGIREELGTFFSAPLQIEGAIGEAPKPILPTGPAPSADTDHPFVRDLIEKLGARPL